MAASISVETAAQGVKPHATPEFLCRSTKKLLSELCTQIKAVHLKL
jgi:hypothetical protein